ncbi:hydrolase, NUDIX family, NudH subfamily protein [Oceanicola granulosus HTCC2516]|uniref:RNA pyrophosphohydrolase n=1 Tax=Oceanicola granulosus (strain ATCC BAA-861 / DSM 15982 / KCTC 12143 / HTCC2516) TaxID=314256 RepID=Q2CD55_OCEGH|nr:RNA pyrophosphohydrolase [Oceanicola granulosus]EAR50623.1 hydrolase, NUDIX family, NudH subfamily protein [Oceanicola granulosus HTCC2516]
MTPDDIARLPYRPCVGVVLANARGEVFVGQRADRDEPAWQMPQGGLDAGESVREAALRELVEETGVGADRVEMVAETADWLTYDLPAEVIPTRWGGRYRGQKQKWVLLRFTGADTDIRIDTDHPEFSAWAWVRPDEALERIVPFKRPVYAAMLEELGPRI